MNYPRLNQKSNMSISDEALREILARERLRHGINSPPVHEDAGEQSETEDPDEPTEAEDHPQGVDDEGGEVIGLIADLLKHTDNDFKASMLATLQKRQDRIGKIVDDNEADGAEICFDAVVGWLRSRSREAKLTAVLMTTLLSHEHVLPNKNIANELYQEFEAETLAINQGDFVFITAYTAGMMAVPC